jgi:hypothetical protein
MMIMPVVPIDDDLMSRFEAYLDATDERPTIWTPEHVQARMVEAFDVLMRSGVTTGPSQKSGFWPPVVHEFSDMVDQQARTEAEARSRRVRHRPTSDEASRMEEALAWPMRYLDHDPLQADALTLWCLCNARDRQFYPILHKRKVEATKKADRMTAGSVRRVLPHEAVPGLCLSPDTLTRKRKKAAETIAKALIKARIVIR